MKHIFIINPISGKGSAKKAIPEIEELMKKRKADYEIKITEYPKHAQEIAKQYTLEDDVCLYSVGGDGTAYEILNGLNDGVCFCIIPCGTGNDFYRLIDENALTIKEKIEAAVDGKIVSIDYGVTNHSRFLNCTTFGFDAEINHMVNTTMKKTILPSALMYSAATVSKMIHIPQFHAVIDIDGAIIEQDVLLCAIMNGQYYGGGFNPTPNADIQDGYFDLCIVEPLKRLDIIKLIGKYAKGKHTQLVQCKMLKGKEITIKLSSYAAMQSDGEDFVDNTFTCKLIKNGIKMKVPQSSNLK